VLLAPLQALLGTAALPAGAWLLSAAAAAIGWGCARIMVRLRPRT
jgi:hypothetical protein